MKIIRFKDIRVGDTVSLQTDKVAPFLVVRLGQDHPGYKVYVKDAGGYTQYAADGTPEKLVWLLHRPWPEGKTGVDLLLELRGLMFQLNDPGNVATCDELLAQIREAIEVYELGKPLEAQVMQDGEVGPEYPPDAVPLG